MKNYRKTIWIFMSLFFSFMIASYIKDSNDIYVNTYLKSSSDGAFIMYTDNRLGDDIYPYGSGGSCDVLALETSNNIKCLKIRVKLGTENKIRIDFSVPTNTVVEIKRIDINYYNQVIHIYPQDIKEKFGLFGCNLSIDHEVAILKADGEGFTITCEQIKTIDKCLRINKEVIATSVLYTTIVVLFILFLYYWINNRKQDNFIMNLRFSEEIAMFIIAVLISGAGMYFEYIAFGSFKGEQFGECLKVFIYYSSIIMGMLFFWRGLVNLKISLIVSLFVFGIIEVVNFFMIYMRNENFAPWHLRLGKEAAKIVSLKDLPINKEVVLFLLCIIFCIIIFMLVKGGHISIKRRLVSIVIGVMMTTFLFGNIVKNNVFGIHQFALRDSYNNNGTLVSFLYFCQNAIVEEPENYNEKTIESIVKNVSSEKDRSQLQPNIIMIMSEAFWDPRILENVEYDSEFMKDYDELIQNHISGQILSSHFGGGTCDVEFEALTGFSMDFIQSGLMPYQGLIDNEFFSIARYLKSEGYATIAMHPFSESYYSRNRVYPYMGFDKCIFQGEFEQDVVRGWTISDYAVINKIIEEFAEYEKNDIPTFIFAVTLQNHQPYGKGAYSDDELVSMKCAALEERTDLMDQLNDFSTGIDNSSKALGELISYLENTDRPIIVIYWGDHMCNLGSSTYETHYMTNYLSEGDNDDFKMYLTPIIVWDNIEGKQLKLNTTSTFQILPTVFDIYNLKMPKYFELLLKLQENSRGRSHNSAVLDSQGEPIYFDENQIRDIYEELELLQYDYIYGNKYMEKAGMLE